MQKLNKITLLSFLLYASAMASPAQAETNAERAILNAQHIIKALHGVVAESLPTILDKIKSDQIRRLAPEQPIWIIEIINGTVLYYQGSPSLEGKPASELVDSTGFAFGNRAIEFGKLSRSGWINVKLGANNYRAYCKSQYPFVACSVTN